METHILYSISFLSKVDNKIPLVLIALAGDRYRQHFLVQKDTHKPKVGVRSYKGDIRIMDTE